jgi:hypothetical protein
MRAADQTEVYQIGDLCGSRDPSGPHLAIPHEDPPVGTAWVSAGLADGVVTVPHPGRPAVLRRATSQGRDNRRSGVLGRRSQFAARPLGWSDLACLLEQAGAPAPCQISIPKPLVLWAGIESAWLAQAGVVGVEFDSE